MLSPAKIVRFLYKFDLITSETHFYRKIAKCVKCKSGYHLSLSAKLFGSMAVPVHCPVFFFENLISLVFTTRKSHSPLQHEKDIIY